MRKRLLIAATARLSFRSIHKPLTFDVSDSVGPSYVQWRGWSYAASVPSDTPNAPKGRKKISKHERRAMVESYVTKFRATNAGKFPTATDVIKQVGGGYYFVREIILELEYKSRTNSSNRMDKNLLEKEQFDESKRAITVAAKVSSDNTGAAKERTIQENSQSVVLDERETITAGYEHLEEKRGLETSSWERRLSKEVEIISTPGNHCIASESNLYPSSLQMPNDVKNEEAVCNYSEHLAPTSDLPQEERKGVCSPSNDNYGTVYGKASGHESEFVEMENHQIMEEKCIGKAGYERREQAALGDQYEDPSHSTLQVPKDVKTGKDMSRYSSASAAPERHQLKEEIEHISAPSVEKSGSSHSKSQSHDAKFVDMENHPILEEKSFKKAGYETKEQNTLENIPGIPNHKLDQSQGSSELDESKINNSTNRETSGAAVSQKSSLWGNLKSLADGIINIWRKL